MGLLSQLNINYHSQRLELSLGYIQLPLNISKLVDPFFLAGQMLLILFIGSIQLCYFVELRFLLAECLLYPLCEMTVFCLLLAQLFMVFRLEKAILLSQIDDNLSDALLFVQQSLDLILVLLLQSLHLIPAQLCGLLFTSFDIKFGLGCDRLDLKFLMVHFLLHLQHLRLELMNLEVGAAFFGVAVLLGGCRLFQPVDGEAGIDGLVLLPRPHGYGGRFCWPGWGFVGVEQIFVFAGAHQQQRLFINFNIKQLLAADPTGPGWQEAFIKYLQYNMSQSDSYSSQQSYGWISWFCNLEDHQFFCRVDEQYIRDSFNLYGLKQMFDHYNDALEMILRPDPPEDEELEDIRYLSIYQQATDIYGLIHARYIVTPKGLAIMRQKFLKGSFGVCPRVLCQRQHTLPIGMSEEIRTSRVKIYCPRCEEVYMPKKKCHDIDGAYFGCSFPNILLMVYPDLRPKNLETKYIPRVYGFKIYGKKGSKFELKQEKKQISFYTQEELKKIKHRNDPKEKKQKK